MTTPLANERIGFVGGGNMAASLIGGLINTGISPQQIYVSEPNTERKEWLEQKFKLAQFYSSTEIVSHVSTLVLAVKPQIMPQILPEIAAAIGNRPPLVLSIAAGIPLATLSQQLGDDTPIIRIMPNTPALVLEGATGMFANANCNPNQKKIAQTILSAVGQSVWVNNEDQIDAVTALSGSGPAYFFLVFEAMIEAGQALGLSESAAKQLTLQTAYGAAKMAMESPDSPEQLRQQVTSPGGTTQRALEVLEQHQLKALFLEALTAAKARAKELANASH